MHYLQQRFVLTIAKKRPRATICKCDLEQQFAKNDPERQCAKLTKRFEMRICKLQMFILMSYDNLHINTWPAFCIVLSFAQLCTRSGHGQWPLLQAYYILILCTKTKTKCTDDKKSFMRGSMEWNGCFLLDGRAGWTHMHVEAHFEINSCL